MQHLTRLIVNLAEQGLFPDRATRWGIRQLLKQRLREIRSGDARTAAQQEMRFIEEMRRAPIAVVPEKANDQHYEVPVEFFREVLGPHLKYSSAFWPANATTLGQAEAAGLRESCLHAGLMNGQTILELGCGWGSLTLWMAEHYPDSRITAVSNSRSQRAYIEARAKERGLQNRVQVVTCDMNTFEVGSGQFDRVVSVEMFEHMRNWPDLFARVRRWLRPGGQFFMHVFVHRATSYLFEDRGPADWMSREFFTGGMMPSDSLPRVCQDELPCVASWRWNGTHYEKTANAWLTNMDAARETLWPVLERVYGKAHARAWWERWRIFFMACAELFGYEEGHQWGVSHYLFEKPAASAS
ncbi:MAG: class I SAM-dependent methyltransferase [Nitrospira sp.]|nr:class I SAM-dependent methyltransferase [Nitrospira sp.]MBP0122215.1 class I SAM-dependent methyltransferase [Nitrospira sp.]MBP0124022.1 class I SAM-dependent methyltransferase [Nitrospira sp.]MBP0127264.1 class I SAM-dependent methyltransferase [Nitrospira sp.]MBP0130194.1 class I SAM-dependent methyltransferase [Nitrospira sp.]